MRMGCWCISKIARQHYRTIGQMVNLYTPFEQQRQQQEQHLTNGNKVGGEKEEILLINLPFERILIGLMC